MANGKGELPEQIWLESQPELLDSAFVKASIARARRERPPCIASMLKRMLQERSSYLIGVTCNDQRAPAVVSSRVPSPRFRLSIRIFLALQAFSDLQGCASATTVSQACGSPRRLAPLFPPSCNFYLDVFGGTSAVAIPNIPISVSGSPRPANMLPTIRMHRIRSLSPMPIPSTDDLSTGVLPGSFALAFRDLVFRPTFP
jgi:hypothetical protein